MASSNYSGRKVEGIPNEVNPFKGLLDSKIAAVVAQVDLLENEYSPVTNAEIDSHLRSAQRQMLEDKIFSRDRSVDAMALS